MRRIMHMFNSRDGRSYDSNEFFAEEREDNTPEVDIDVTSSQFKIERFERIIRQIEQERAVSERDSRL